MPTAEYFTDTDDGKDRLDAICMILIAVGEAFKRIDRTTDGKLLRANTMVAGGKTVYAFRIPAVQATRRKLKEKTWPGRIGR
jgi:hypothetical protein